MMRAEEPSKTSGEPSPAPCPSCHDRGFVVVPDGGAGSARPCDCRKLHLTPQLLGRADIPERYRKCTLKSFNTRHTEPEVQARLFEARQKSEKYVDEFFDPVTRRFRGTGLIYVGPPGVGKTHLATAVLKDLIVRYKVRGRFVDFTSLLHQIQSTFDPSSSESKHQILDPVIDAEILVLDELGAHKKRWSDWVMEILYLIINTRYTRRLPTLFTTNYLLEDPKDKRPSAAGRGAGSPAQEDERPDLLTSRVSPNLVSRLYEMAQVVRFSTFDYRREIMQFQHRSRG